MIFRILLFFHLALGLLFSYNTSYTYYWGVLILVIGLGDIVVNRNSHDRAAMWAAYWVGMEVFLRMVETNLLWESGKYGTIILLMTGFLMEEKSHKTPKYFVYFIVLLIPSILVINFPNNQMAREEVAFNLSGPICLALSSIYFFERGIMVNKLFDILKFIILPVLSMSVYLALVTPDLSQIIFSTESNYETSGGFGPNQVSTVLGIAILIVGVFIYYRKPLTGMIMLDAGLLAYLLFRGLITFSKGGILTAGLALLALVVMNYIIAKRTAVKLNPIVFLVILACISIYIWNATNESTQQMLSYRYSGIHPITLEREDVTSGRLVLLENEIRLFVEHPILGIGPGMTRVYTATHSEFTRLLAEHGVFGLVALFLMIAMPNIHIFQIRKEARPLYFAIFVIVLMTLLHSAMRLAIPAFLYGLLFSLPMVRRN